MKPACDQWNCSIKKYIFILHNLCLQGYLFVSVLIGDGHDLMPLIIQGIRHDVESQNPVFNTLAMQCIANIANKEMVEQLGKEIPPVLTSS